MTFRTVCLGAALLVFGACSDSVAPSQADQQLESDVQTLAGEAVALQVDQLVGNESGGGFGPAGAPADSAITPVRTRTCYDADGNVQAACDPSTTAKVVLEVTVNDTLYRDGFTGYLHRQRADTVSNLLGTETFRIHNAFGTSADTTTFTGDLGTRTAWENGVDSVVNVRFDLPRSTHPWPTSGTVVRNVTGEVTFTGATQTTTRSYTRRIVVAFPADAQGNVTIQINARVCNLNLVTHRVTSCQ